MNQTMAWKLKPAPWIWRIITHAIYVIFSKKLKKSNYNYFFQILWKTKMLSMLQPDLNFCS